MQYSLEDARRLVIEAGLRMVEEGYTLRTYGNIGARISDKQIVVTPSGRSYDSLVPEDIVVVNISDCSYEGVIVPSSEVGMIAAIFKARPDVGFMLHTHQPYASAVSILEEDVDDIPCTKYGISGSDKLVKHVRNVLKRAPKCNALLLSHHGAVMIGDTMEDAFDSAKYVESKCKDRYEYLCAAYLETADRSVEVDYGESFRKGDRIYVCVEDDTFDFETGMAYPKALRSDVPHRFREIAMMHDAMYKDFSVNYVKHVKTPSINAISHDNQSFRPYIDDQAQVIGLDAVFFTPKVRLHRLTNDNKLEKLGLNHGAVLITTGGALCTGNTKDDLAASEYCLEKACMARILANLLHHPKPIPKRCAKTLREKYITAYSKLRDYAVTASEINEVNKAVDEAVVPESLMPPKAMSEQQPAPEAIETATVTTEITTEA